MTSAFTFVSTPRLALQPFSFLQSISRGGVLNMAQEVRLGEIVIKFDEMHFGDFSSAVSVLLDY